MVYRCVLLFLLASCLLLSRILTLQHLRDIKRAYHQWVPDPTSSGLIMPEAGVRDDKFVEVLQILWGLNNQKIALTRAVFLTANKLNQNLLMPKLSASLFHKEIDLLEPLDFDHLFSLDRFNSLCHSFVRISHMNSGMFFHVFVVAKGNVRRWTTERDMAQLEECRTPQNNWHTVIKLEGKHPFLWHDHWPVRDYARVFQCLVLVDTWSAQVSKVVSKLKSLSSPTGIDYNKRSKLCVQPFGPEMGDAWKTFAASPKTVFLRLLEFELDHGWLNSNLRTEWRMAVVRGLRRTKNSARAMIQNLNFNSPASVDMIHAYTTWMVMHTCYVMGARTVKIFRQPQKGVCDGGSEIRKTNEYIAGFVWR